MKVLNRNHIKLIALITMLIDHIGCILSEVAPQWLYYIFRIIGRVSFPLFCYFVAEGYCYTKSKPKYILHLLLFGIISTPFHSLLFNCALTQFNIMFTFIVSILFMLAYDNFYKNQPVFNKICTIFIMVLVLLLIYFLQFIDISFSYGLYGILLPYTLYVLKDKPVLKHVMFALLVITNSATNIIIGFTYLENITISTFTFDFISLFAIAAIPIMLMYNGNKGKHNLKYLFYTFYPAHMLLLYLISLIIF